MTTPIPRLPVLDWNAFSGEANSATPCLLDHVETRFTTSGRAAILLALEMMGIGPGDRVLLPSYHCPTMVAPVVARGAEPMFYPIDAAGAPQFDWLEQADTQGVRVLLAAHFFGLPQPMAKLRRWCDSHDIRLIEDCAHALFGKIEGRAIGRWGDLAIASLTKFLPVPEGGCLVNNAVAAPVPVLRRPGGMAQLKAAFDIIHNGANHGRLHGLRTLILGALGALRRLRGKPAAAPSALSAEHAMADADGFSIDPADAHLALSGASRWIAQRLPRERILQQRRACYRMLSQALSSVAGMRPLRRLLPDDCAPYVFPLWVDTPDPGYQALRRLGFPVSRWDQRWPTIPDIADDQGPLWSHHILQIGCHQDLSEPELQRMLTLIKQIYATGSTPSESAAA